MRDDDGTSSRIWRLAKDASGPILSFGPRKRRRCRCIASPCMPGSKQIRVVALYRARRDTKRGDAARLRLYRRAARNSRLPPPLLPTREKRIDIGGVTAR